MITFAEAWDALAIDDTVSVSNGLPEPAGPDTHQHRVWRSHNFTGTLVEKIAGPPRRMRIQLAPSGNATVSYTVLEGVGHDFTAGGS